MLTSVLVGSVLQAFTGTVGGPLPLLTYRLEAVPEMGYDPSANPPRGEIIIKGPVVFKGYFKVAPSLPLLKTSSVCLASPDATLRPIKVQA